jgi:5'-nucleotidase
MKILIANDDGIAANGIRVLTEALTCDHEVYVIAPDRERSAAGHSLTLHTPLRVEELEPFGGAKRTWVTTGTPGDCVKIGINAILGPDEQPDVVIAGINHGPNLGIDILYSGTVSCAMEGAMHGIPSIAVSLSSMKSEYDDFKFTGNFINSLLKKLPEFTFPPKGILNINTPTLPTEDIAGVAITELGDRMFTNTYDKRVDPRDKVYYWMAGELTSEPDDAHTDIAAIRNNLVSITPVTFEMTKRSFMADLEKVLCSDNKCYWY